VPDVGLAYWISLGGVTVLTSIVSGMMGMVGGMLLLSVMLLRLEPAIAIPVHGVVQLVSNGSRAYFLRRHIKWGAVWRFAWPLLPGGLLGIWLGSLVSASASRVVIGAFVLAATWLRTFFAIDRGQGAERFLPVGGFAVGACSTLIGATGPLLGPFILALELTSQGTIATLAACQVFQHATKVALFGLRGFDLTHYLLPCLGLCLAATLGSAIGTRLLDHVPEKAFRSTIRVILTGLALLLVYQGLRGLLSL
jgi:uncharacterized protein